MVEFVAKPFTAGFAEEPQLGAKNMSRKTLAGLLPGLTSLVIGLGSATAQQSSTDVAEGALAQCWTATVTVTTLMDAGHLDPELTAEQTQSLYEAIEARNRENYAECIKKMNDVPQPDK